MDNRESVSDKFDRLYDQLVGKVFRNRHMMPVGTIVDIVIERDEYYKSTYFYAILDNGDRINTIRLKGVK
jgi:hypothetical protein